MAEPTEGTYVILSVGSQKAMDVKGGSDKSGTNVQQWDKNNSDAQMWALTKPEGTYWQVLCSLTGKCLDVESGKVVSGTNVRQWSDNNTNAQRWAIETTGGTYTYQGTTYDTYTIKPSTATNLALDVEGGSGSSGANIRLYTSNNSNAQKWILIPLSALTNGGTYTIVLANATGMCIDIAGQSTANSANVQIEALADRNSQVFKAEVNAESLVSKFINANSEKVLDTYKSETNKGTNVVQYLSGSSETQNWMPYPQGSVKIDGQTVPTYTIRLQASSNNLTLDASGQGTSAGTNIQVWTRNNTVAQNFAFIKTEITGASIEAPGVITNNAFSREGYGDITIGNLTFPSKRTDFQARYMIRRYKKDKSIWEDTKWKNVIDDSEARSGWGDAWAANFSATPVNGIITLAFDKTVTLDSTYRYAEIYIEIRAYEDNYNGGYKAHSSTTRSTITLTAKPTISLSSIGFVHDSTNGISLAATITDSMGDGGQFLRGRLIHQNGSPMSEWVTSSTMQLKFVPGSSLRDFPSNGESISFEYIFLTVDGDMIRGSASTTFNYSSTATLPSGNISYTSDDSYAALISYTNATYMGCYIEIEDTDGTTLIPCDILTHGDSSTQWKALPPLNKTTDVKILTSSNNTSFALITGSVFIESRTFIWNWTSDNSSVVYDDFASLLVNTEKPPRQTRSYSTDITFNNPASRVYPVAFAGMILDTDLSVTGVAVDNIENYVTASPLPQHIGVVDILKLVRLSGRGIHPIYRTPYGDWHIVGIENVDVSKSELGYSSAVVKQKAVGE